MDDTQALTTIVETSPLDLAISAWLHAHGKRITYDAGVEQQGLDLDGDPGLLALAAQAFAYVPAKGKEPHKSTINHRLACLSSFYNYARRKKLYTGDNPIEAVDRAKVQEYAYAEPLDEETVHAALAAIDQSTMRGARDYALLSVLLQTARRVQEVASLQWQHVSMRRGKARLTFEHA